jgi:hypothetical protein
MKKIADILQQVQAEHKTTLHAAALTYLKNQKGVGTQFLEIVGWSQYGKEHTKFMQELSQLDDAWETHYYRDTAQNVYKVDINTRIHSSYTKILDGMTASPDEGGCGLKSTQKADCRLPLQDEETLCTAPHQTKMGSTKPKAGFSVGSCYNDTSVQRSCIENQATSKPDYALSSSNCASPDDVIGSDGYATAIGIGLAPAVVCLGAIAAAFFCRNRRQENVQQPAEENRHEGAYLAL